MSFLSLALSLLLAGYVISQQEASNDAKTANPAQDIPIFRTEEDMLKELNGLQLKAAVIISCKSLSIFHSFVASQSGT